MTPDKLFSIICFLVLMENGGVDSKSPDCIKEKFNMVGEDIEYAFSRLDHINQASVIDWCNEWSVPLPQMVIEYLNIMDNPIKE